MKKLLSILVLSLLFGGSAFAGTCKTPKNPKEKFVLAPEPVSYTRKSSWFYSKNIGNLDSSWIVINTWYVIGY